MKKITAKNVIYLFQEVILYSIFFLIADYLLYIYLLDEIRLFALLFLLILFIYLGTILLPVLFLYFNYLKFDKNKTIILKKDLILINELSIPVDSIERIIITATYQHFDENAGVTTLPYNDYFYYVQIYIKNKEVFLITSLLDYNIDKELKNQYSQLTFINRIKSYPLV